jgi:acetyltransferase-like isoleucine patch superfamily enzyme
MSPPRVAASAVVEDGAEVGDDTAVWDLAQVRRGARVGPECVLGRGAFVDEHVVVGRRCKIQNDALLYHPARLGNGVFVGPGAILTNDLQPRAVNPDGSRKDASDWQADGVEIGDGASIGAGAVVVAGARIGAWAMVAAGAVVRGHVPPFALVAGVPARRIGWVGRAGARLVAAGAGRWHCPVTGESYVEGDDGLELR